MKTSKLARTYEHLLLIAASPDPEIAIREQQYIEECQRFEDDKLRAEEQRLRAEEEDRQRAEEERLRVEEERLRVEEERLRVEEERRKAVMKEAAKALAYKNKIKFLSFRYLWISSIPKSHGVFQLIFKTVYIVFYILTFLIFLLYVFIFVTSPAQFDSFYQDIFMAIICGVLLGSPLLINLYLWWRIALKLHKYNT